MKCGRANRHITSLALVLDTPRYCIDDTISHLQKRIGNELRHEAAVNWHRVRPDGDVNAVESLLDMIVRRGDCSNIAKTGAGGRHKPRASMPSVISANRLARVRNATQAICSGATSVVSVRTTPNRPKYGEFIAARTACHWVPDRSLRWRVA